MKYKIGDEVLVKVTIKEVNENTCLVNYPDNMSNYYIEKDSIVEPSEPVTWRDGEIPDDNDDEEFQNHGGIYYIEKNNIIFYPPDLMILEEEWADRKWLYANEFPMPSIPEPEIPPCPVCGHAVHISTSVYSGMVYCSDCGYRVGSLEEHIELCRRLKE